MDQLSIDASNAIKAGMSYGKYMAMKPRTDSPKKPTRLGRSIACEFCGEQFVNYRNNDRKYCSDDCRNRACVKRKKEYPKPRTCCICGKEFMATTWRSAYCSEFCVRVGRNERVKECLARKKEEAKNNG